MNRVQYRMNGINLDAPASEVKPEIWTGASNMISVESSMKTRPGEVERLTDPGERVHYLVNTRGSSSWWVYVSDSGIFETDGATANDITPLASWTAGTWTSDDVTGCTINGLPYILGAGNGSLLGSGSG